MKLTVCALLLVLVPAAYCVTTANVCRIAGTVVGAVLGGINGGTLEKGCSDTSNACKDDKSKTPGIPIATNILSGIGNIFGQLPGAGKVVQGALNVACTEVATGGKIAEAAKAKDPKEVSAQISKVVCTPINYAATVTTCHEAVKAAKVRKGSDLSKVKGCEKIQFIDNLGKPCIPQAA